MRPETTEPIEDRWCFGTLHVDGIQFAESSRVAKSIEIVTFTNRCCNPCKQKSSAFSLFLGILGTGKNTCEGDNYRDIIKAMVRQLTETGKQGVYIRKNDRWYHLRWGALGFICDYAALTKLTQRGNQNSDSPCVFCDIKRELFIPFLDMNIPKICGHVMDSTCFKVIPNSYHFLHPLSTLRQYQQGIMHVGEEAGSSMTCGEYGIWDSICIPTKINNHLLISMINHTANQVNKQQLSETSFSPQFSPCDFTIDHLSSICTTKSRGKQKQQQIQQPQQQQQEGESAEQDEFCLPVSVHTSFSMDVMHAFRNFFENISKMLNNEWKSDGVFEETFKSYLLKKYPQLSEFSGKITIPEMVNALALCRLDNLPYNKEFYWIDKWFVLPDYLSSENTDHVITYFLCLFNYAYQDSMDNPVVNLFSRIIDIMSEFYCLERDRNRAQDLQTLLSSYLGQLESILPPTWRTTANHIPNHLLLPLFAFGPLYMYNNFNEERRYRDPKNNNTRSSHLLESTRNREFAKTSLSMVNYSSGSFSYRVTSKKEPMKHSYHISGDIEKNLIDDYFLCKNTLRTRHTYLDDVIKNTSTWDTGNKKYVNKINLSFDSMLYKEITFAGRHYTSCDVHNVTSLDDLEKNTEHICCIDDEVYGVHYFLVEGFCIAKCKDEEYPVALCRRILTGPMSTESNPYHYSQILSNWLAEINNVVVISLRRLKQSVLPLRFKNNSILALTIMRQKIHRYLELPGDNLIQAVHEMLE